MFHPEGANQLGVMTDCSGVDHAEAEAPCSSTGQSAGPVGQVAGQAENMTGVVDGGLGARTNAPSSSIALEQRNPDTPLEFGEPLRQGGGTHADTLGGQGPRRGVGDGDEVLELANREIGERPHQWEDTSDLLHNPTSM